MAKIVLARPEVAEKYDCTLENDIVVHAKGYSGKISKINLAGAEHLAKDKNLTYFTEKKVGDKTANTKATASS